MYSTVNYLNYVTEQNEHVYSNTSESSHRVIFKKLLQIQVSTVVNIHK